MTAFATVYACSGVLIFPKAWPLLFVLKIFPTRIDGGNIKFIHDIMTINKLGNGFFFLAIK